MIGDILILISGIIATVRLIPQILKTLKTKSVDDFSSIWVGLVAICAILFPMGCLLNGYYLAALSYLVPCMMHLYFMVLYFKYRRCEK